jgi:TRAP-type C4-dicarboxylate transport system permease small subunit
MNAKKLPIWLRILCATILGLIFLFILGVTVIFAILLWSKCYNIPSFLLLGISLWWVILTIRKVKKWIKEGVKDEGYH